MHGSGRAGARRGLLGLGGRRRRRVVRIGVFALTRSDAARTAEIGTTWFTEPDFVEAECVHADDATYLALTVDADPADPRGDDIGGDLSPEWGMHLIDVNVALGNLVDLVASQGEAYAAG